MNKLAMLIYNPRSGRQKEREIEVKHFIELMNQRDFQVEARRTERPRHASDLGKEAASRNLDLVVANGGDGTLNEVLQGMIGSQVPLAVWPAGTANVVALDLKLPRTPFEIVNLITRNDSRYRIHVALAGTRYYFFTAGIGLDAEIIEAVDAELKKQIGKGAFWIAGFSHLIKWNPTPITLKIDGKIYQGTFAIIGKSFGYGGTLSLTPYARLDEDMLDVCIFSGTSKLKYISYLASCLSNSQLQRSGVTYLKTRRVEVSSIVALPVQADGEVIGNLPMTFEVIPNALTMVVPPGVLRQSQQV
ncbi:MAG: diacylglycerol kinase family lipid kinase [Acidobacteria bacterium]|nr:diacylglycerol kinase family lipid kinase [Acidobacteriota bacterium]